MKNRENFENKAPDGSNDMLDILFAQRNRAYGAYALRRQYDANLGKALLGAFLLLTILFLLPALLRAVSRDWNPETTALSSEGHIGREVRIEKAEIPKTEVKTVQKVRATISYRAPVVIPNDAVSDLDSVQIISEILNSGAAVGANSQSGATDLPPTLDPDNSLLGAVENGKPQRNEPEPPFTMADVQKAPSFPGGDPEMFRYLSENIRYPVMARDVDIQGTVVIGFVVEADGSISSASILKEIGGGCGTEALRVVNAMPRWIPGEAHGKNVRVRFTLPVRFQLE